MQTVQLIDSLPRDIWERRPEPRMLSNLQEASSRYLFGGAHETLAACADVLAAQNMDEFEESLELVAHSGDHINGLDMMVEGAQRAAKPDGSAQPSAEDSLADTWTVVQPALTRVLGGAQAAAVFSDGLFLLYQRHKWSRRAVVRTDTVPQIANPETPDPVIWGELFKVDKGDACFAAVLSLLVSGRSTSEWLGVALAACFREGQAAGVRVFASIFSGDEADAALRLADVKRIDWQTRRERARRVDEGVRALQDKWDDRSKTFSPFGHEEEEEEYDDDGDHTWKPLGELA